MTKWTGAPVTNTINYVLGLDPSFCMLELHEEEFGVGERWYEKKWKKEREKEYVGTSSRWETKKRMKRRSQRSGYN